MRPLDPGKAIESVDLCYADGSQVSLASLWSEKPAVSITGSLTCPPSRLFNPALNSLAAELDDRFGIHVLYVIGAHPSGDLCAYKCTD